MLKIRLKRVGRKHDPSFRVVVTEKHRGVKSGKYIENLGSYDARTNNRTIKADRVKHWIGVGAQVSDTVHNLLVKEGVIEGKAKNVLPKKTPIVGEKQDDAVEVEAPVAESGESADSATQEVSQESPEEPAESEVAAEPAEEAPVEDIPEEKTGA